MTRGALKVIGYRPVVLVSQFLLHEVGHHRRHATQLRMAEGIARTRVRQKLAFLVAHALRHHDRAVAPFFNGVIHFFQESLLLEGNLRKQDHMRRIAFFLLRETAGSGNPPGVTPHDLEHEDLGRARCHRLNIQAGFHNRYGHILGHRAESGTGIGDR